MPRVRLAALICSAALLVGLGIGFAVSGGSGDAAAPVQPAGTKLQRLAAPAVGAIDVPALKLRRRTTRPVTTPPPPPPPGPVVPPAVVPPPVPPPPPVVITPPPPPPPPPPGPDVTRR
jgi:hypothetical protein